VRRTLVAVVVAAGLLAAAPMAFAHQGNPHFRSDIKQVTPPMKGISVSVLNYDDRLLVQNTSGQPVVIDDYNGKPYARILADRTVQVNTNSPAYYLNDDRYADVTVPKGLGKQPNWKLQDRTGRFEWHDHRIHWMAKTLPPQVKDQNRRTHIFDWRVPISIGGRPGAITGSLTWVPLDTGGSVPMAAIWGFAALLILLSIVAVVVRRRRLAPGGAETSEAW
jgi:hypothetical protein